MITLRIRRRTYTVCLTFSTFSLWLFPKKVTAQRREMETQCQSTISNVVDIVSVAVAIGIVTLRDFAV